MNPTIEENGHEVELVLFAGDRHTVKAVFRYEPQSAGQLTNDPYHTAIKGWISLQPYLEQIEFVEVPPGNLVVDAGRYRVLYREQIGGAWPTAQLNLVVAA